MLAIHKALVMIYSKDAYEIAGIVNTAVNVARIIRHFI